ncbi:uncharacterized protein C8Q71DRAFT_744626 [Rhodofomes roseus]|uniref:Protein AF-9 homolog n=1 Tax=Rhodofomes roseus TaxID=34475 RepID=A0ABQ8KNY9_9APHY|nr:uncharacterized protein C8Q71DRAFT_744626 [Rhodofomes roseus]KAH9839878.1 hypothetical protein C8Q71DRAFT_744626 [Rhodofomes roseus]
MPFGGGAKVESTSQECGHLLLVCYYAPSSSQACYVAVLERRGGRSTTSQGAQEGKAATNGDALDETTHDTPSSSPHAEPSQSEKVAEDDLCPICHLLLYKPVTTPCKHSACQSCMARWADISVSSEMVILPISTSSGDPAPPSDEVKCPMCRTLTTTILDATKDEDLRTRYPQTYLDRAEETEESEVGEGENATVETLTIHLGNTHKLRNPGEGGYNAHQWTFFVRPSNTYIIEEVRMLLHPTFRPPCVHRREPPYEITRLGWGFFTIVVLVILKVGYTWVSEDAVASPDGHEKNMLTLEWTLDFDGGGSQGRVKLKVKKEAWADGHITEEGLFGTSDEEWVDESGEE